MIIKKIKFECLKPAIDLVWKTFLEYEAPDYSAEGITEFKNSINDQKWQKDKEFYGAYEDNKLRGVIATKNKNHIALFFVDGAYHKKGIGKKLFAEILKYNEDKQFTVNSSPYAKEIYEHLGFKCTNDMQIVNGLKFYPMITKLDYIYTIREIEEKDNKKIEEVIRKCLIEFGANHEGTAWTDPNLGNFSKIYNSEGNKYWVAEDSTGKIIGGVGIGSLDNTIGLCELQKMYCLPEARGKNISHELMKTALSYAQKYYDKCYLETLENMIAAQKFYEKYKFKRIYEPIVATTHFACDVRYIKDLHDKEV